MKYARFAAVFVLALLAISSRAGYDAKTYRQIYKDWDTSAYSQTGVPANTIRALATSVEYRPLLLTDKEVVLCDSDTKTMKMFVALRVPLINIRTAKLVSKPKVGRGDNNAYNWTKYTHGGIELTFKAPVAIGAELCHAYELKDPSSVFTVDVHASIHFSNGQPDNVVLCATRKGDDQAANDFVALVNQAINHLETPSAQEANASVSAPNSKPSSPEDRIKQLRSLLDQGLIDKATYDQKVAEIIKSM